MDILPFFLYQFVPGDIIAFYTGGCKQAAGFFLIAETYIFCSALPGILPLLPRYLLQYP